MRRDPWLGAVIWADLKSFAALKGSPSLRSPLTLINVLLYPGVMAVIVFRLACFFHRWYLRPFSRLLYILNLVLFGAELMPSAKVGPGLAIPHPVGTGIGGGVRMGRNVRMFGLVRLGGQFGSNGQPTVGDDCWLLDGAKIFGGVTIGDRSVVGADSLVLDSVPSNVIVAGRPARVIRSRDADGTDAMSVAQ